MPILVRPVREQLEHDRIIRLLQVKYKKKHEVAVNVGAEQTTPVENGTAQLYPDVVLYSPDKAHALQGTIEVETGESVNSLEAMAQWTPFSKLRAPFYLYIPPSSLDTVRRLCSDHHIAVAEIWTYHVVVDQVRFMMVHRSQEAIDAAAKAAAEKPEKPARIAKAAAEKPEKPETPTKSGKPAASSAASTPAPEPAKAKRPAKAAAKAAARPAAKPAAKNGKAAPAAAARKATAKPAAKPAAKSAKAKPAARKR